jgi:flavin reductase (DIM6/NTAB) family NADH-FMN oxidoreductase RutF
MRGDAFHELTSWIDYPMFIVTAAAGDRRAGCLVGYLTQASMRPPRLLALISKVNFTFRVAAEAEVLGVHFLSTGNLELARLFGEETEDRIDKFERCRWEPGPAGVPVLLDARGWVAGRIEDRLDAGDHVAHLLDPIEAAVLGKGPEPALSFHQVRHFAPGHPL